MGCGCNRRARAAAEGKVIRGYRVIMPKVNPDDENEPLVYIPPLDRAPLFSAPEARAEVRAQGGGTVYVEYA